MSTIKSLADQPLPLEAASVTVGDDGNLAQKPEELLRFAFSYAGIHFVAQAERRPDSGVLLLQGDLGPMPFSAEGTSRRGDIAAVLAGAQRLSFGSIGLSSDQRIRLLAEQPMVGPLTPVRVLAVVTAILVRAKPWLDLLDMYLHLSIKRATAQPG